jgi:hypothetical protein
MASFVISIIPKQLHVSPARQQPPAAIDSRGQRSLTSPPSANLPSAHSPSHCSPPPSRSITLPGARDGLGPTPARLQSPCSGFLSDRLLVADSPPDPGPCPPATESSPPDSSTIPDHLASLHPPITTAHSAHSPTAVTSNPADRLPNLSPAAPPPRGIVAVPSPLCLPPAPALRTPPASCLLLGSAHAAPVPPPPLPPLGRADRCRVPTFGRPRLQARQPTIFYPTTAANTTAR